MDEVFKIYVEQLREGRERKIVESLDPSFLDIAESDLLFRKPVELQGVAYIAENELILHWDIQTEALMSCSVCNEPVPVAIRIENFYAAESLDDIKTGVYDLRNLLRETILLELPAFTECNAGRCPGRKEFSRYLRESSDTTNPPDEGYRPFADLDWKQ